MNKCNNCLRKHRKFHEVCLLSAMLGILVSSRESLTSEQAQTKLTTTNVDQLWDDVSPILDGLENGEYEITEDEV